MEKDKKLNKRDVKNKSTHKKGDGLYDLNKQNIRCPICNDLLLNYQLTRHATYCCRSCQVSAKNIMNWQEDSYREHMCKCLQISSKQNMIDKNNKKDFQDKAQKEKYISRCKNLGIKKSYLYYAKVDNTYYKIGVTTNLLGRKYVTHYEWIKPLMFDKVNLVADLEYQIKQKYCEKNSENKFRTECFKKTKLSIIKKFIMEYINE